MAVVPSSRIISPTRLIGPTRTCRSSVSHDDSYSVNAIQAHHFKHTASVHVFRNDDCGQQNWVRKRFSIREIELVSILAWTRDFGHSTKVGLGDIIVQQIHLRVFFVARKKRKKTVPLGKKKTVWKKLRHLPLPRREWSSHSKRTMIRTRTSSTKKMKESVLTQTKEVPHLIRVMAGLWRSSSILHLHLCFWYHSFAWSCCFLWLYIVLYLSPRGMTQGAKNMFFRATARLSKLATLNPGGNGLV